MVRQISTIGIVFILTLCSAAVAQDTKRGFQEIRRFTAREARQGIAVDDRYFYAITDRAIGKYDKRSGEVVQTWEGPADGPIIHLDSGVVLDGLLYCAHSNYPGVPMVSSIEIWDTRTLEHVGSHSVGIFAGSATWIDRWDGYWWIAFANYAGSGGEPGKGPEWTTLVKFHNDWHQVGGYIYPPAVVERFGTMGNSGGTWGEGGRLYITGHNNAEI